MAKQCPTCICYSEDRDQCILERNPKLFPLIPDRIFFGKEKCEFYFEK
jgi:hypothetical protein